MPESYVARQTPFVTRSNAVPSLVIGATSSVTGQSRAGRLSAFISYVEEHFFDDGWSLDVCAHRALKDGTFTREQIVCTKTLYDYADLGLLNIRNIDLPEKLHCSPKTERVHENK